MEIPKIIHQTWKNKNIPEQFLDSVASWKIHHPDWEYVLWTDEMNMNFLETYYPDFIVIYNGYENNIQRVDAVRYFILYHFGGIYVDLDFHCFKNVAELLKDADCAFGKEHALHALLHGKEVIISNAIMACRPKAKFMKLLCDELYSPTVSACVDKNEIILDTTGPFMLTRICESYGGDESMNVRIIDSAYLYPLSKDEISNEILKQIKGNKIGNKLDKAFAMHYYWGSWWSK